MRNELFELGFSRCDRPVGPSIGVFSSGIALNIHCLTAGWIMEATRKLEALGRLQRNWDSHDGLPILPVLGS